MVHEVQTVWEMGERIVDFAFGDVCLRASHTDSLAGRVADRNAPTEGPNVGAGFVAHTIFTHELRSLPRAMRDNPGANLFPVVGVNVTEPLVGTGPGFARRVAEHMVPAGRKVDFVRNEIPVPESVVRATGGKRVALLTYPKRLEGVIECLFTVFDLAKHFVERAD